MQLPFNSKSRAVLHESVPVSRTTLDMSVPQRPGMAGAGLLMGTVVSSAAIIALVVVGQPLLGAVLIAFVLQCLTFYALHVRRSARTTPSELPQSNLTQNDPTPSEAPEIWRTFPSCCDVQKAFRIGLISNDLQQSRKIATNLTGLGPEVHHCTDPEAMFDSIQACPQGWGLVIFDLDAASDRKTALADLQDFREECPELPVLILSGAARQGTPTHDCRLFGGVTPKSSALPPYLIEGLTVANLNVVAVH